MSLADSGNAEAQIGVGLAYMTGHGVKRDPKMAFKYVLHETFVLDSHLLC
jgi:TPR repeat protein